MANPTGNIMKIIHENSYQQKTEGNDLALIEETGPSATYTVKLKKAPTGSVLVKTDNFHISDGFLSSGSNKGLKKRADYALITGDEIIFIELKSTKSYNKKSIERQILGAICVIDYCDSIGRHFFNDCNFLHPSIGKQAYFLIHVAKGNKRTTTPAPSPSIENWHEIYINGKPQPLKKIKISGESLYYRHLSHS